MSDITSSGGPIPSTTPAGLTSQVAEALLRQEGPNELPRPRPPSAWRLLVHQLTHMLALLLWAAAGLALVGGMAELAVAIVVVVLVNAGFAFVQEYRADRSAERLRDLLPATARVYRDGQPQTVPVRTLVRGDVVLLAAGDRVAADARVTRSDGLALDESLMTGESAPVRHAAGELLLAGTFVVRGEGEAVVQAVGGATAMAGLAALSATAERPPSPLTRQLDRVVRTLAVLAVAVGTSLGLVAVLIGLSATEAFLFAVGVTVALVPEGLLPTVTLSLARGSQLMARQHALVRRLDAVESLGSTTFICTDKTGTLTQNRMAVVEVWTPAGAVALDADGYAPPKDVHGDPAAQRAASEVARSAVACVTGRSRYRDGRWVAEGDPMEAAIHRLALTCGWRAEAGGETARYPFTPDRMLSSVVVDGVSHVLGAPEQVLRRSTDASPAASEAVDELARRGRRVLAVARRRVPPGRGPQPAEDQLQLLGLLGLEDPPRPDVAAALRACRTAAVRVAMVTGDHPSTAAAIAREVGLLLPGGAVLDGARLPADDRRLAALLDRDEGAVVARVTPADKLRIARVLRERGHVVAMTGDGVNDAPALREADVGIAMGASGSDVAREAADLVLLDDHFATIVAAVELGRATFANIRRFLTYHLTDNVAELTPFAVWALSGGNVPLAIGVLQVLALDIGTDMLPALGLGAEPPSDRVMHGAAQDTTLVDRALLHRAFGVLGPVEAVGAMAAFAGVLLAGGWSWGLTPAPDHLALASGTAFAVIAVAQLANAFACRSTVLPAWRLPPAGNPLLLTAVALELLLLVAFLAVPPLPDVLGGHWPGAGGWAAAVAAAASLLLLDGAHKSWLRRRSRPAAAVGTPGVARAT